MTNELNLDNELRIGDVVGDTKRMVIASTKKTDRVPGDSYATWVAICCKEGEYHPYVVWTVIARPEGFAAETGDYCSTLDEAVTIYKKRGGQA
ncbi:MAG: hypothetical protein RLZZ196_1407 [Bacteroidota bacterium]|jgi:hypothetical protein